ncbi:hypothetical protein QOT17_024729 [Balamuthia mandrillaris]
MTTTKSTLFALFLIGLFCFQAVVAQEGEETATAEGGDKPECPADPGATPMGTLHLVIVAPNGELVFQPNTLTVSPGDTVMWLWDADGHNVDQITGSETCEEPSTLLLESPISNRGYNYRYVVREEDVDTTIFYKCDPHCDEGMRAQLNVVARSPEGEFPLTAPNCFPEMMDGEMMAGEEGEEMGQVS